MNLSSCPQCGVVLDLHRLDWPEDIYLEDGAVDTTKAVWEDREYKPMVRCPLCNGPITQEIVR